MLSRLTFDAAEVAADTTKLMPALSGGLVRGAGAFCALFALDPLFTTLYAIGAAALISLGILLRKKAKAYQREVSEAEGKSRVFMQESLGSVVTLKAYGAEQKTAEKSRLDVYKRQGLNGFWNSLAQRVLFFPRLIPEKGLTFPFPCITILS